jgi:hypothetical protein
MFHFLGVYCLRPALLRSFPSRKTWRLKTRISEGADGHGDQVRAQLSFPEHCSAALRAEAEVDRPATVRDTCIVLDGAFGGLDLVSRIPRVNTEGASGPALTCEAMTHRDSDRLTFAHKSELPAATRRLSNFHAHVFLPLLLGSNRLHESWTAPGQPSQTKPLACCTGLASNRSMCWELCASARWVVSSADP